MINRHYPIFSLIISSLLFSCGSDNSSNSTLSSDDQLSSSVSSSTSSSSLQSISSGFIVMSGIASSSSISISSSVGGSAPTSSSNIAPSSSLPFSSNNHTSSSLLPYLSSLNIISSPASSSSGSGSITWQGKTYRTTYIGGSSDQTWFAENLDVGTQVSASSGQVNNIVIEKSCYDDVAANCTKYGGLYSWAEAMALPASCNTTSCAAQINAKHQGLCPDGWHIPVREDFNTLLKEVGIASIAGLYLKSETGWPGGYNGRDDYGFCALPGGGYGNSFLLTDTSGIFWESNEYTTSNKAYAFAVARANAISNSNALKTYLFSVRCVKD